MTKIIHIITTPLLLLALLAPRALSAQAGNDKEDNPAGESEMLERLDGASVSRHDNTTAISPVDASKMAKYSDFNLSNALQGLAPGLIVRGTGGNFGSMISDIYVRGQHGTNPSQAVVIIDGMVRGIDDIMAEEIGTIQVIKDASAKIIFGPRASNGAIVITTKRGEPGKRVINASVEYGVTPTTRDPRWLGAAEYAKLFNEAREADGLSVYYSASDLAGLAGSSGPFDQLYPTVNWKDYFTRSMGTFRRAHIDLNGGSDNAQYALLVGYTGGGGNEKVGSASQLHRFNVRGNLDVRITDFLKVVADVAARLETLNWGSGVTSSDLYGHISTARPNEYHFTLEPSVVGKEADESGIPFFGASDLFSDNLYADMLYGGTYTNRYVNSQSDLGLDFDFNKYVSGLTAGAYITFDNYSLMNETLTNKWPTYYIDNYVDSSAGESSRVVQARLVNRSDDIVVAQTTKRYLSVRGNVGYERVSGPHAFSANAAYIYSKEDMTGAYQDIVTSNGSIRLNYSYAGRYLLEVVGGFAGTNALAKSHRYLFTPAVSAGWVISEEPFLKNSSVVDFLKLKASAGRLGVLIPNTTEAAYLRYHTWANMGTFSTGQTNSVTNYYMVFGYAGNPDLGWTTSTEFNVGLEGAFLSRKLSFEANAFMEIRDGENSQASSEYSAAAGQWLPFYNFYKVRNKGVEAGINWCDSKMTGDLSYSFGLNFTATRNEYLRYPEVDVEAYRKYTGRPTSAIFGPVSEGLFGKDVQLEGHTPQAFGAYGTGDLAYKNLNDDDIIDSRDFSYLGQTFPLTAWGLNAGFNYKGFGAYVLLTAETGASFVANNAYFWNYKSNGYSELASDRWHPVNNPGGTLPRLSSYADPNTYQTSSFWVRKQDWLRLKDVELSYTLRGKTPSSIVKQSKFFVRGTNLLVLTPVKGVDPEVPDAGVTNYPYYATVSAGVSLTF